MGSTSPLSRRYALLLTPAFLLLAGGSAFGQLNLGPEELVQAGGVDILVPGYSVPSFTRWDGDGLADLIVGEGSGVDTPKVRVYLNVGTPSDPQFSDFFYAQSEGADLTEEGDGCMGLFPRTVYWDGDDAKDLLVGVSDGTIKIYLNVGTDDDPTFDAGTFLQVGEPDLKVDIDVGKRPTPSMVDWNNDGRKDLVTGALDGLIRIFINEGTDTEPDFITETILQTGREDLVVPEYRSSPVIMDLDDDGKKDLLTGNTAGQILFYSNIGTDASPAFADYECVESDGVAIDLDGLPRSRPFVADWTGDGRLDLLVGAGTGNVHLYQGVPLYADVNDDGVVDIDDLFAVLAQWGDCDDPEDCPADINGDGTVDIDDIFEVLANWT
ncbi:MAG: VCBS repeat-containing protein [Phycisphaerales bacterium]|nr:MAG: VCBS repeat-containing protein [Phycisphaerales bacterium]